MASRRENNLERGHSRGIENAPKAFIGLMKGENFGKLLVKVKL